MAQLPPKIPNITPNAIASAAHNPSWADEFLEFSSVRRGFHRRSVSDSIAFLEAPTCMGSRAAANNVLGRFDDEIAAAMAPNEDDQSTSSGNNSVQDEKKAAEEVQSQSKSEPHKLIIDVTSKNLCSDRITDPKRVKRILANRQSARRSRVRKLQYITELERSVSSLQAEVSMLSPRVAFLDQQRLLLNVDNSALKQRIAALSQDNIFKDAHQEALKREIERLGELYDRQQNQKQPPRSEASPSPSPSPDQKDELLYV